MFSDEVREKIFAEKEVGKVPLVYQSIMIYAIQKVLEEEKNNADKQSVSATDYEF
jgi:hypothetical protein